MHSLWEWGWSENIQKSRKCGKKLVLLILWPPVLPCDTQALEGNITRSVLRFGLPLRQLPDHPGYYGAVTTHRANVLDVPNVQIFVGLLFYSPRPMLSCTALHYKSSACEFPNQVFYKKLQLDSLSCAYGCKQFRWNFHDRNKRNHKHFVARCCHGQGL